MDTLREWIEQNPLLSESLLGRLAGSVLLLLLLLLLRRLVMGVVNRRSEDPLVHYRWRKFTEYLGLVLLVVGLGGIWLGGATSLATYLGLLSAGLAIALQDPITNLVAWLFIVLRRPFEVGDRIAIGEHAGDVVEIRFFLFTLAEIGKWVDADQSTGRLLQVPNRKVFSEAVANYSGGLNYIWHEIGVLVTFESDWRQAKALLTEIVQEQVGRLDEAAEAEARAAARKHLIYYGTLTPIVYTRVVDSGVRLTMRYLVEPRQRRGSEQAIWEAVLDAFAAEPQIELAYPTQRIYFNPGDPALPPPA